MQARFHIIWNVLRSFVFRRQSVIVQGFFAVFFAIAIFGDNKQAMAQETKELKSGVGAFSLSWAGGMEYGSRQISFDGIRNFYFAAGDTLDSASQSGVGVFELYLQNADLAEVQLVGKALCDSEIQKGGPETVDPPAVFSVNCLEDGQVVKKSGSIRLIPGMLERRIFPVVSKYSDRAYSEGKRLIKLDFSTVGIEKKNGEFIVSVKFVNSGNRWIKFKTPDQWPKTTYGGTLGVSPTKKIGVSEGNVPPLEWGFPLAGQELRNRNEFPDGVVVLNPGDVKIFRIVSVPSDKFGKGEYEFSGVAFMNITYEGDGWGLSSHVDFRPTATRIKFDHDYPSTPEEREQWEKTELPSVFRLPTVPSYAAASLVC